MDILDFFWTFYLNHLSPLWGYFYCLFYLDRFKPRRISGCYMLRPRFSCVDRISNHCCTRETRWFVPMVIYCYGNRAVSCSQTREGNLQARNSVRSRVYQPKWKHFLDSVSHKLACVGTRSSALLASRLRRR